MAKKYDIFISYRRKGGVKDARLVDEKLRNSGYSVSFDIDTLGSGKFTDTLKNRLRDCKDFIIIFEPTYYERFYDESGNIQKNEILEQDWCYLELKNALLLNKNIIPLVHRQKDGKDFIFPGNLPQEVKEVAEMNAIQLTEKEFTETFEYKVKRYLKSKPKFTYRYRMPIIATLALAIIATIAYLVNSGMEASKKAAEEAAKAAAERERSIFVADSIKKAGEDRAAFIADSIRKIGEMQTQSILDSIKAKEDAAKVTVTAGGGGSGGGKTELYWVSNGEETGKILYEKLSGAGLKTGKCSGNGIKVSVSKCSCKPNSMGSVRCSYQPQITMTGCTGSQIDKLIYPQTFNGADKIEAISKQRMLEDLQKANFSSWVSALQSRRK